MRTHILKAFWGSALVWLMMPISIVVAAGPKDKKDDRDVIQEAAVFHIMLRDRDSADVARRKLSQVPAEILLFEFKALAKSSSLDRASALAGGDLGIVREGEFEKEFETAIFLQPLSTVSEPIKSSFGWHLVYVTVKGERAVLDICRESLAEAITKSKPQDRERLQVSAKNDTLMQLQPDLVQLLGSKWSKPFVDWNNNLALFKKPSGSSTASRVQLLVHTEYLHPIYNANPLACKRSMQQVFDIDCGTERVALRKSEEFEGRGGIGRRLSEAKLPKKLPGISAGPNGYYKQLVTQACSK